MARVSPSRSIRKNSKKTARPSAIVRFVPSITPPAGSVQHSSVRAPSASTPRQVPVSHASSASGPASSDGARTVTSSGDTAQPPSSRAKTIEASEPRRTGQAVDMPP